MASVVTVTNLGSPTNEAVQGVSVAYSIMGCSAAPTEGNGPVDITVAVNNRLGQTVATQTVTSTSDDPSVAVTGDIYVGVPDVQYLWVTCTPAEGDAVSASSAGFYMTEGTITASQGDNTVIAADQPVTLTSDSITGPGGSSYPFMPGAEVALTITAPDGTTFQDTVVADEFGIATWTGPLPTMATGAYTATMTGMKYEDAEQMHVVTPNGMFDAVAPPPAPVLAQPVVEITNDDATMTVSDGTVTAHITGCTADEGAGEVRIYLYSYARDRYIEEIAVYTDGLPAAGVDVSADILLPGYYAIDAACWFAGDDDNDDTDPATLGYGDFFADTGYLDIDPGQWTVGDPVTVSSPTLTVDGVSANTFDPNSQVHLVVTGPDGTVHDLGMFTTNADGKLVATGVVLPLEVDGIYTVVATGTLDGRAVTLETSYRKVTPEPPPVAPPGSQPTRRRRRPTSRPRCLAPVSKGSRWCRQRP